jgi:hypothetical protein
MQITQGLLKIESKGDVKGISEKKGKSCQIKKLGGSTKGKRIVVGGSLDLNLEKLVNGCF